MKKLLLALALFLLPISAEAATCFQVPLAVSGAVAGTAGVCRLTVSAITGSGQLAGDTVNVAGITGATGCNVSTTISTVVDSTHIELAGTTFGGVYAAGGTVGGGHWGTGNSTNWASGTGGTVGTCAATGGVPKQSADTATFDGASGGGTVTVDTTMNGTTLTAITAGAFTGTLDFSVNNPSMSFISTGTAISFTGTGTGRIFKLGSGTFTISDRGSFDFTTTTGAGVQSLASATIVMSSTAVAGQQLFAGGGFTYGTLTINGRATGQGAIFGAQVNTFTTVNLTGPLALNISAAQTITNLNVSGNASNYVNFPALTPQSTTITLTVTNAAIDRAILRGVIFAGSSPAATNSIDMGNNNMNGGSITPPSGGGGHIIGG